MVLSHPCAMRAGPRLRPRVIIAPVSEHQNIPLVEWSTGHFRFMPLPALEPERPDQACAAKLEEPTTIDSQSLPLEDRLASLSDRGIVLLQQRYIHNHSRASIPLGLLHEVSAAVLEELELQESWNLAHVAPLVEDGGDLPTLLEQEAEYSTSFCSLRPRMLEASVSYCKRRVNGRTCGVSSTVQSPIGSTESCLALLLRRCRRSDSVFRSTSRVCRHQAALSEPAR